jgi:hypothetical protein
LTLFRKRRRAVSVFDWNDHLSAQLVTLCEVRLEGSAHKAHTLFHLQRERETEADRGRQRQTERQMERERETVTETEAEREIERDRETKRGQN